MEYLFIAASNEKGKEMGIFGVSKHQKGANYLQEGLEAHKQKDAAKAVQLLERALKNISRNDEEKTFQAYLFLGVNYKRLNNLATSYEMYSQAAKLAKSLEDITEVHNALGKVCYLLNRQDEAVTNYIVSLNAAIQWTTQEHFNVLGGNLYHHLGHALADFDTELADELKLLIPEYKKSLMGQPHQYNEKVIPLYMDLATGFWKENKSSYALRN